MHYLVQVGIICFVLLFKHKPVCLQLLTPNRSLFSQIVNGPEVLSKFVGETEKNVRDLFADAENDQRTRG